MGEVEGKDEETLDEELWGKDGGEESEMREEEEKSGGKQFGEDEMVAKTEEEKMNGNEEEKGDKEDEKEEDEKEGKPNELNGIEELPKDEREFEESQAEDSGTQRDEEAETMELPERMELDGMEENEEKEGEEGVDDVENDGVDGNENDESMSNMEDAGEKDGNEDDVDGNDGDAEEVPETESGGEVLEEDDKENEEGENNEEENDNGEASKKTEKSADAPEELESAADRGRGKVERNVETFDDTNKQSDEKSVEERQNAGVSGESSAESDDKGDGEKLRDSASIPRPDREQRRNKPGSSDDRRNLASKKTEKATERDVVIHDIGDDDNDDDNDGGKDNSISDADYQHTRESVDKWDAEVRDAATAEQRKRFKQEEGVEEDLQEEEVEPMDEETDEPQEKDRPIDNLKSEKTSKTSDQIAGDITERDLEKDRDEDDVAMQTEDETEPDSEIDGTLGRNLASSFHSRLDLLPAGEALEVRLDDDLALFYAEDPSVTSSSLWEELGLVTEQMSQELCEELRLILEPSEATKLKGDYRSGKRINMRKVIPYVASDFRKDKIWLRRTKPSKRNYQIMIALDDSGSMSANESKKMAFEALSVLTNALTKLEAGEVGVVSFGDAVSLLHPFEKQFTNEDGAKVLSQFTFAQKKTHIAKLLNKVLPLFLRSRMTKTTANAENAQLLIIVSDGRGLFGEGMEKLNAAVRRCRQSGVFIVLVIVDDSSKDSVFDIRIPVFKPGRALPDFTPYLDALPFPFYLILKDIAHLPGVLSEALSQWFEMVTAVDR